MSRKAHLDRTLPTGPAAGGAAAAFAAAELQRGVALHQGGNLDGAEAAYRAVLQRLPRQADALHMLGVVCHQRGDSARAVDLIRRSQRIDASNPHALINLGAALQALGRLDEAEKSYRAALERLPGNAEINANLAAILRARDDLPGAIAALRQALAASPERAPWRLRLADLLLDDKQLDAAVAEYESYLRLAPADLYARNNLGVAFEKQNRYEEAAAQFRQVVAGQPALAEAHANLGNACSGLRLFDEAEEHYRRAIELAPGQWRFRINLANLLLDSARVEEAKALCDSALSQGPDDARMLDELALRLVKAKRPEEAIAIFRKAIEIDPTLPSPHNNLGNAFTELQRFSEAEAAFREAVRLDPKGVPARLNLCGVLQKTHQWDEAMAQAFGLRLSKDYSREICDSRILQMFKEVADFDSVEAMSDIWELAERMPRELLASTMLTLLALADDDAKLQRLMALVRKLGHELAWEAHVRPLPPAPPRPPVAGRKIRLGFLSSDLRSHSVAKFVLPVFRHYDRERFEITCYSVYREVDDPVRREIVSLVDRFRTVNEQSDREIALQVRDDGIDVLIDLNGYTMHSRLSVLTYRPAAVQAVWLGWPFTTGMEEIDYFMVDRLTRPADGAFLVEKPLEMSGAFVCFESFPDLPLAEPPFLANGHITFGTLNACYKFSRAMVARWAEVMHAVEGSRMVIVRPEASSLIFLGNIVKEFERNGIDRSRLDIINNRQGTADHLSYYNLFDISLDTFPVTGGTTTTDALWMGVPVVSQMGQGYHQRIGGAIAMHCGLDDLCVTNGEDFVRVAIGLANDRDRLAALRRSLRETLRDSPLCRADKFMAGFQDALGEVAQRHVG